VKSDAEQQLIHQVAATLSSVGGPAAISELQAVASGEPDEDPEPASLNEKYFYQRAQIQLARLLLAASNGSVGLPDVLNRFGSMPRSHVTRTVELK
jgi:Na+(H+)/acetate symporter ActP